MQKKVGRNDLCPCGSGKKFKKCCEVQGAHKKINAQVISPSQSASKIVSLFHRNAPIVEKPKEEHSDVIL